MMVSLLLVPAVATAAEPPAIVAATASAPALPQAFHVRMFQTYTTSCFVQCPSNCTGPNIVPSCPMPPGSFVSAEKAFNYDTNKTWQNQYNAGLKQNYSSVVDCVSGLTYELSPFMYPQPREVCSGYGSGYLAGGLHLPAMGVPSDTKGPWAIPAGATKVGQVTIRGENTDHWQYVAKPNSSVGNERPAGQGLYRWHTSDVFVSIKSGLPLKAELDESVRWLDREYLNYTTWDKHTWELIDASAITGEAATSIFDVSKFDCKLMLAPPAAAPPTPSAATDVAVTDALIERINSAPGGGASSSWTAGHNGRFAGLIHAEVAATIGLPTFKAQVNDDPTSNHHQQQVADTAGGTGTSPLPTSWDIRKAHPECIWAKTIIDQGSCGSCWAWAASGALSSRLCMASHGKQNERLSTQWLVDCNTKDEQGCGGGALDNVWKYLTDGTDGVVSEACYPYYGGSGSCPSKCKNSSASFALVKATKPWSPANKAGTVRNETSTSFLHAVAAATSAAADEAEALPSTITITTTIATSVSLSVRRHEHVTMEPGHALALALPDD